MQWVVGMNPTHPPPKEKKITALHHWENQRELRASPQSFGDVGMIYRNFLPCKSADGTFFPSLITIPQKRAKMRSHKAVAGCFNQLGMPDRKYFGFCRNWSIGKEERRGGRWKTHHRDIKGPLDHPHLASRLSRISSWKTGM